MADLFWHAAFLLGDHVMFRVSPKIGLVIPVHAL